MAAGQETGAGAPRVFQIYYRDWHRAVCDPAFVALDNRGPADEYLEFDLFERLSASPHVAGAGLWGALSWRFTEKTGLSGAELFDLIAERPGHDVYFVNPHPEHEGLYHNLWRQGETAHPRFAELSRAFLVAAGLPGGEVDAILPSRFFSAANYFVGRPAFWAAYLPFVRGAIRRAEAALPADVLAALHSQEADGRSVHGGCTYMPFIVERLFALFLRTAGAHLSACKLPLAVPEDELTIHHRQLRELKDRACAERSPALAACWVNYRTLFLQQQHGRRWAREYLRAVTPAEVRFA